MPQHSFANVPLASNGLVALVTAVFQFYRPTLNFRLLFGVLWIEFADIFHGNKTNCCISGKILQANYFSRVMSLEQIL